MILRFTALAALVLIISLIVTPTIASNAPVTPVFKPGIASPQMPQYNGIRRIKSMVPIALSPLAKQQILESIYGADYKKHSISNQTITFTPSSVQIINNPFGLGNNDTCNIVILGSSSVGYGTAIWKTSNAVNTSTSFDFNTITTGIALNIECPDAPSGQTFLVTCYAASNGTPIQVTVQNSGTSTLSLHDDDTISLVSFAVTLNSYKYATVLIQNAGPWQLYNIDITPVL